MSFLKNLFHPKKPQQEMHGMAPLQSDTEQQAVRERMETEVTRGKEQRAARVAADAADAAKDGPA